jgi:hypothetical protein
MIPPVTFQPAGVPVGIVCEIPIRLFAATVTDPLNEHEEVPFIVHVAAVFVYVVLKPLVVMTVKTSASVVAALPVTSRLVTVQPNGTPTMLEKVFSVPTVVSWFRVLVCRLKTCVDGVNELSDALNDSR